MADTDRKVAAAEFMARGARAKMRDFAFTNGGDDALVDMIDALTAAIEATNTALSEIAALVLAGKGQEVKP